MRNGGCRKAREKVVGKEDGGRIEAGEVVEVGMGASVDMETALFELEGAVRTMGGNALKMEDSDGAADEAEDLPVESVRKAIEKSHFIGMQALTDLEEDAALFSPKITPPVATAPRQLGILAPRVLAAPFASATPFLSVNAQVAAVIGAGDTLRCYRAKQLQNLEVLTSGKVRPPKVVPPATGGARKRKRHGEGRQAGRKQRVSFEEKPMHIQDQPLRDYFKVARREAQATGESGAVCFLPAVKAKQSATNWLAERSVRHVETASPLRHENAGLRQRPRKSVLLRNVDVEGECVRRRAGGVRVKDCGGGKGRPFVGVSRIDDALADTVVGTRGESIQDIVLATGIAKPSIDCVEGGVEKGEHLVDGSVAPPIPRSASPECCVEVKNCSAVFSPARASVESQISSPCTKTCGASDSKGASKRAVSTKKPLLFSGERRVTRGAVEPTVSVDEIIAIVPDFLRGRLYRTVLFNWVVVGIVTTAALGRKFSDCRSFRQEDIISSAECLGRWENDQRKHNRNWQHYVRRSLADRRVFREHEKSMFSLVCWETGGRDSVPHEILRAELLGSQMTAIVVGRPVGESSVDPTSAMRGNRNLPRFCCTNSGESAGTLKSDRLTVGTSETLESVETSISILLGDGFLGKACSTELQAATVFSDVCGSPAYPNFVLASDAFVKSKAYAKLKSERKDAIDYESLWMRLDGRLAEFFLAVYFGKPCKAGLAICQCLMDGLIALQDNHSRKFDRASASIEGWELRLNEQTAA